MKKYNKKINLNFLIQDGGETKNLLDNGNKILSELYNIKFEDDKIGSNDGEEELEVKDKKIM